MATKMSERLLAAMRDKTLVRLSRRFEKANIRGYVLDVGPKLFLLGLVSDRIRLDGYECFRIEDIKKLKPDPYAAFVEAALHLRGIEPPAHPPVSLASLEDVLRSASAVFPLITIHEELTDPEVCWMGKVVSLDRRHVSLLSIAPGATWEETPDTYRLRDITRVGFGDDYEDALQLVGGPPPPNAGS